MVIILFTGRACGAVLPLFSNRQILMRQDIFRLQLGLNEQSWLISRSWVRSLLDVKLPLIAIE